MKKTHRSINWGISFDRPWGVSEIGGTTTFT